MPDTSSAVPEDLLRCERVVAEQATACALATVHLQRAAAALASSRSAGLAAVDLAALGRRLRGHVEDASVLADRTGDVGHAFALAGGGAGGAVAIGDAFIEACLRLPDGRALTVAEIEALPYGDRLRWLQRFLASDVVPADPNFRAVAGVLAAAHASGEDGLWNDDAFRLADAALLEAMQLGLLVAASGGAWRAHAGDPRSRAVGAWIEHASAADDDQDSAWAWAEEESVRYGETVADRRGLRFDGDLEPFIRFSHVYRVAVHRGEHRALLAEIAASLDPIGLARLADDVREVIEDRVDAVIDVPLEPVVDWLRRTWLPLGPPEAISEGLDLLTRLPVMFPAPWSMYDEAIERVTPGFLAALLLDPSATPPRLVASVLDEVLGVRPPMTEPPASYYVGMLADQRYLRGLPTHLDEIPDAVPRLPGE